MNLQPRGTHRLSGARSKNLNTGNTIDAVSIVRARVLCCGLCILLALSISIPHTAIAQAILTHPSGNVKLGADTLGQLNVPGGNPSISGETYVGVRLVRGAVEYEYTAQGCDCEGWGVADGGGSGLTGFANNSRGSSGLTLNSFTNTLTKATSDVTTSAPGSQSLNVIHDFKPSASSKLIQVDVTISNTGTAPIDQLLYRRNFDFDVDPTPYWELVTLNKEGPFVIRMVNSGFGTSDPLILTPPENGYVPNTNVVRLPLFDQGAEFNFDFGELSVGAQKTFTIFYGAADDFDDAFSQMALVGADPIYALGEPDPNRYPIGSPDYSVAIFAFKGVNGPQCEFVTEQVLCELNGEHLTGDFVVTGTFTNLQDIPGTHILLPPNAISPAGVELCFGSRSQGPIKPPRTQVLALDSPLNNGDSFEIGADLSNEGAIIIKNANPGDEVCFRLVLLGDNGVECCTVELCVEMPPCDCLQVDRRLDQIRGLGCSIDLKTGDFFVVFEYRFQLTNLFGQDVSHAFLAPLGGETFRPDYFDLNALNGVPLGQGQSVMLTTIVTSAANAPPGDLLEFLITIHNEDFSECCSRVHNVVIPDCAINWFSDPIISPWGG